MDKKKLITKIIFGEEDLSKVEFPVNEEIKQNFEIAWDVWENFENIKETIRKILTKNLVEKINDEFSNLFIIEGSEDFKTKGRVGYPLKLYKPEYKGIYFALEFLRGVSPYFLNLSMGIRKENENVPFSGDWENSNLSQDQLNILEEIYQQINKNFSYEPKKDKLWIIYINLEEGSFDKQWWRKEFYDKLFNNKPEDIINSYISELRKFIDLTEDKIIKFANTFNG